ncbi:haloacid dehalogenase-like family hydrolase [Listeria floridensis FSL S10-1187]|uniref:Haloacid dehalogenase-like family hydrolase n=1 Tax=Listeria floridensis FSL S10-1187 TaxID=1265817 RepID=A0ABP3B367_9LIST|nr:HAD-IA family hydrolase [Listeria floridensis]EUJ33630.1 haloacid dehalogenase-like family hydrolase [Listeria floridensis FSL S10-1187]
MKAIIFDFDGTMIDTENLWHEATMSYVRETYGIEVPASIYEQIIGTTEEPLHDYLNEATNGKFDQEAFTAHIEEQLYAGIDQLELREGFKRVFDYAVQNGFKIGLATSSGRDWVEPILKKFDLLPYFSSIQTADDVEKIKPDPTLYLQAKAELASRTEKTYAVEDSLNGVIAAQKAGLSVIAVPNAATAGIQFPKGVPVYPNFDAVPLEKVFAN